MTNSDSRNGERATGSAKSIASEGRASSVPDRQKMYEILKARSIQLQNGSDSPKAAH